jgi:hypothetical protein
MCRNDDASSQITRIFVFAIGGGRSVNMRITSVVFAAAGVLAFGMPERADAPVSQIAQYVADGPKTIVELQQFRQTSSIRIRSGSGREGTATLVSLNPDINAWYLLSVAWNDGGRGTPAEAPWHLENPKPHDARIVLDEKSSGIAIVEGNSRTACDLFGVKSSPGALEQGRSSTQIYYPLCDGRLYLRNAAKGARTALESTAEFLRTQVWGGEQVVDIFHHILGDRYRETGELQNGNSAGEANPAGSPVPAQVDPDLAHRLVTPSGLGVTLESQTAEKHGMSPGAWYQAAGNPGVYVSVIEPNLIAPDILRSYPKLVSGLDSVERASLCYLIAFDADRFDIVYSLGTSFPEVNWSSRIPAQMRDSRLPGPDGIGTIAPLISTGLIPPEDGRKTIASFTGGFKREHGAFRYGELATKNHGSHYGFIEDGVVFSKLQPGLATVYILDDGSLQMKTWRDSDNQFLGRIRHARQNGVPLVEFDDTAQVTVPGRLVAAWGPGNWSGSENEKLRSIRAGLGMQTLHGRRFMVYAVFSDATPSAMARVFQSYQLNYGMLTDMNALEHTYLAVYRRSGNAMSVDHLLSGMSVLDKASPSGEVVPRFLGYPDNRDFFYVMRRTTK